MAPAELPQFLRATSMADLMIAVRTGDESRHCPVGKWLLLSSHIS